MTDNKILGTVYLRVIVLFNN